jgi:hypothetical protein
MAEIPELRGIRRGGLQQTLKALIDDARNRVVAKMGSEQEQAVAHWLQSRGRRVLGRTRAEGTLPPVALPHPWALTRFPEYVAAQEALLLPNAPVRAGMVRINPFPATQRKLKRLFPIRPVPANAGSPMTPLSPTLLRPTAKPIPSPLQSALDGFAGYC